MRLLWWRRGCNGGVRLAADGDGGDGGVVETMQWCCSGAWDGDGDSGVMMVVELWWAAVGRQPEERVARGGEWIWGSGRSGHGDNIWFRPERSPESGGRRRRPRRKTFLVAGRDGEDEGVCV
ncbi:hypothetical protein Tco_0061787 [Tanacetum coccineum]